MAKSTTTVERMPLADASAIITKIEHESTGTAPGDPYRARIEDLMAAEFDKEYDADGVSDAGHLRETTGGLVLEQAARRTGFVLGFEYCRDLILSGTPKGGAR